MQKSSKYLLVAVLFSTIILSGCFEKKEEEVVELPSTDDPGNDSGGGGGSTTPTQMTTQGNFRIVFVTSTEVNGTGVASGAGSGLADFDALCETEKVAKGFGGTFKALIGVNQRKPDGSDWILREGKEYRREDLTTVIDVAEYDATPNGVVFPFMASPVSNTITASGTAKLPWTGLKNDWSLDSLNCSDWTRNDYDGTSATYGTYGKSDINDEFVDLGYTQYFGGMLLYNNNYLTQYCDSKHPIYCVQTKQLPPPGAAKILFMSTTTTRGNVGIPAMDGICSTDAVTKGLTGTYKAVVAGNEDPSNGGSAVVRRVCQAGNCAGATAMEQAVDWVMSPNTNYVREDRTTFIGTTNVHGYLAGELEEPIAASGNYWSGMTNAVALSATFQHCGGWVEGSFNGFVNNAGTYSADYGSSSVSCLSYLSVLCAEQ